MNPLAVVVDLARQEIALLDNCHLAHTRTKGLETLDHITNEIGEAIDRRAELEQSIRALLRAVEDPKAQGKR